jgi:hypothetical protein
MERTTKEGLFIMRPPTLRTAEDVARYLEQDFADTLWAAADLVESGAYCPWALLHDVACVSETLARVLRGAGPVEFYSSGTRGPDLVRAVADLASRIVNGNEFETVEGLSGICDSTLATLGKLIREAQPPAAQRTSAGVR